MKTSLTVQDILSDIEIELIQGVVTRDELGQGLQSVRQFQNKLRAEFFGDKQTQINYQELANRQFQLNDLLLTLLQEIIAKTQSLQLELRKSLRLNRQSAPGNVLPASQDPGASAEIKSLPSTDTNTAHWQAQEVADGLATVTAQSGQDIAKIEAAMRGDALKIAPDVRAVHIPVIGWFLTRLRMTLHVLTLFYVNRLATRQAEVNRTYGDLILQLQQVNQNQQEQIERLTAQVIALRARLPQSQSSETHTT